MRVLNFISIFSLMVSVSCTAENQSKSTGGDGASAVDSADSGVDVFSGERTVLFEVFTGSTCGPCNGADAQLDSVLHVEENEGRWVAIKYQVGSDPYITAEGYNRAVSYLSVDGTYAIPNAVADGATVFHPAQINDDAGFNQANFDAFADVPSPMDISVEHRVSGQTVDFEVTIHTIEDVPSESMRLFAAITENVTTLNVGTNGQTEFHDVMKKLVPGRAGTSLDPMAAGDTLSLDFSYSFQGEYLTDVGYANQVDHDLNHSVEEFEDLEVVVFVQDTSTKEVYNAAWTKTIE
jgi:hypothetical protein